MIKAICKKCGREMNIPKSFADYCYDCENEKYKEGLKLEN